MKSNHQLTRNDITNAWRSVTLPSTFLQSLIDSGILPTQSNQQVSTSESSSPATETSPTTTESRPTKPVNVIKPSDSTPSEHSFHSSFIMAETVYELSQQALKLPVTSSSDSSKPSSASSSADDIVDIAEEHKTELNIIKLTDEQIIALSQQVQITFPGLFSTFLPGFFAISQKPDESDLVFAIRRLSSIMPPLLNVAPNPCTPDMHRMISALIQWHQAKHARPVNDDSIERALTETAFHFDSTSNRLIIRHAPIEIKEKTADKERSTCTRQEAVTQSILKYLAAQKLIKSDQRPLIHHITPTITAGYQSLHVVLNIEHEVTKRTVQLDPKAPIPLLSSLFGMPNYYYLSIQSLSDNTDCGRYVAVLATIVAEILAQNPKQTLESLSKDDFTTCNTLISAKDCFDSAALKKLLSNLQLPSSKSIKKAPPPKSAWCASFWPFCENKKQMCDSQTQTSPRNLN